MSCFGCVSDLNRERAISVALGLSEPWGCDESWQDAVCATDGFFAMEDLSSDRRSLRRRSLREVDDMRRSIPRDGLCATDLPREPARHRGLSVGTGCQALPHGVRARDQALDAGRCQRDARLAHPCRIRPVPDRAGAQALPRRELRHRVGEHDLRTGLDDHRSVPVALFRGRCFVRPSRR